MKSFFFNLLSRPVLVGFICRTRKVRTSRFAGVIVVTLLLVLSALMAQRGAFAQTPAPDDSATLDPSVNGTGIVTTPMGSANEEGYSVAIQADGKIVVTGFSRIGATDDVVVVRYNSDGSLDSSFNGTGVVTTPVGASNRYGQSVAIQADGKIVVAGYTTDSSLNVLVVRYNSDGSLDSSFNGTGIVITPIGSSQDFAATPTQTSIAISSTPPCEVDSFGSIQGPNGGVASFSSVVRHTRKGATVGNLHYDDPAAGLSFDGIRISGLTFIGPNHARFSGIAKVSRRKQYNFTVDAYDNGPNGAGDQFFINISNGYSAGGPLTGGDIDIGSCTE